MIISKDKTKLFLGNPKTGCVTALSVLSPYGDFVGSHSTFIASIMQLKMKDPKFNPESIKTVYVFWRDPVEKFISAVNYFRSKGGIGFLVRNKPIWFSGLIDVDKYSYPPVGNQPPVPVNITEELLSRAATITPEQIFFDKNLMSRNALLFKQSYWITNTVPMTVFNYANYDSAMRTIATDFGADPKTLVIPKLNESVKHTTTLSPELESQVRAYYADDYLLKP